MDKNVALAVFFLFSISIADVAHATFRYLAAAPPQNNTTSAQVTGENKQDPNQIGPVKKPENVQPSNNSAPLDPKPISKTDLVSPPQNPITGNSKKLNFPHSGSSTGQNQIVPKDVNHKDDGKNSSPLDKGKNPEHVSGTDLLSPPNKGKSPEHVNGMDLLSPSPVKENVSGTDFLSPSPVKTHVNGTDNRKNGGVKEKAIDDKSNENGKSGGAKGKTNDDKRSETDNGKIGVGKDKTDDKSDETENGKNGRAKEKPIADKTNVTDNEKNGRVKEKSDKSNETDNGKNGGAKEKNTDDKSNEMDNGKNGGVKEKTIDDKSGSEFAVNETCNGLHKCEDLKALIACIQNFDTGSGELTILVQNEGEKTLIVTIAIPTAVENPLKQLKISKHQTQKINISLSARKNTKLVLNAGNGECVLHMGRPASEEKNFIYLPSYDKILTPINGAYFLILSVLIFGVTWACCKCRKRRWNDGVPYQELEMGLPESVSAMNVETAEGWDEGWDDDWDENNAVKSPGASRIGSISANGLTSRSPNRDGWEHDWNE
ncbi:hypothetical protein CUMW_001430 [Citrus unshiu]|nr:hypothetical protein CUMW_001430 [Citrus unshiu]